MQIGYSPIGFVRCGRAACRVSKILWKIGKETGGKKARRVWCLLGARACFVCCAF